MDEHRFIHHGVELSHEGVGEWRKGQRTALVARPVIRALALERGFVAERPVAQGVLGGVLGVLGLLSTLLVLADDAEATFWGLFLAVLFVPLGVFSLVRALRKGTYLAVTTTVGRQKMIFDGPVDDGAVAALLERARTELDLPPQR